MRQINPVTDNQDKQRTYKTMISKYKTAIREGFYFEALLIDYSMIEDRLRSFCYYIGLLRNRDSYKIDVSKTKACIKSDILEYSKEDKKTVSISSISGKIQIVRSASVWASEVKLETEDKYLLTLKSELESLDISGLLQTLDGIDEWRSYRNEIIHALMNKNLESIENKLLEQVEKGMEMARFIDSQVKILKKNNRIRRSVGLKD